MKGKAKEEGVLEEFSMQRRAGLNSPGHVWGSGLSREWLGARWDEREGERESTKAYTLMGGGRVEDGPDTLTEGMSPRKE